MNSKTQIKCKRIGEDTPWKQSKKTDLTILILNRVDIKPKSMTRNKEQHFAMFMKGQFIGNTCNP